MVYFGVFYNWDYDQHITVMCFTALLDSSTHISNTNNQTGLLSVFRLAITTTFTTVLNIIIL